ncbi:MAG: carbon-nitrogen family hydrolase [Candidatus Altiarchaeota archaeon]|nr:carbon-nitrogen family hydrolase [Candidatus Altiarchaeota archaeon]
MNVCAIQLRIKWENPGENICRAMKLVGEAADMGCELACLPELFATGVTLEPQKYAEKTNGPTCTALSDAAKENAITVVGSFIEESLGKKPYNTVVVYDKRGRLVCKYRKMKLFRYGGEHLVYSPGKKNATFELGGFKVMPHICYDLRFAGLFSKLNCEFHVVVANWPSPRKDHWVTLLKARAIETQSFVLGVNMVGKNLKNTFFGASQIISPHGEVLASAGGKEQIISADISVKEVREYRSKYNPP